MAKKKCREKRTKHSIIKNKSENIDIVSNQSIHQSKKEIKKCRKNKSINYIEILIYRSLGINDLYINISTRNYIYLFFVLLYTIFMYCLLLIEIYNVTCGIEDFDDICFYVLRGIVFFMCIRMIGLICCRVILLKKRWVVLRTSILLMIQFFVLLIFFLHEKILFERSFFVDLSFPILKNMKSWNLLNY
ncbi:hypothetical protein EDEG_01276 [Edhazardia aedis USNM 41457]|uniref:Uncharacterized protein n=1 Tax=Edhazardia aedis (strain USNM 41457) TaxID=1003232 RepID=J8ZXV4_EDHAE|nr:hypothetical protein EDEG_01276 [Edhazardia aedis USNM 41457]|eukprot:EJW04508.1 hypothetical protein EDEG_01276 [Edhazardia aedis USNM 41457]